jgi:hypothetical protein
VLNSDYSDELLARSHRETAEARARNFAAARVARGPRTLAIAGPRVRLARWLNTTVLRAEPCPNHPTNPALS